MQYRHLGRSGLRVSALSLGSWVTYHNQVDTGQAREMMAAAYDAGVNFFDNAEVYAGGEAERMMGDVIADLRLPRDGYAVSSKVMFGSAKDPKAMQKGLSRKHVRDACDGALRRLRVDYLDLYFCHRPDPDTSIEETVWAMDDLIRQGKVLYWGTSEWSAAQIREAAKIAKHHSLYAPSMEQPQYNLLHRERVELEFAPLYAELGLGTTTWSPLGSGLLTGKYNETVPGDARLGLEDNAWLQRMVIGDSQSDRLQRARKFTALATELGLPAAPLAIAWCLRNPHVSTVILGASRVEQLLQNLEALTLAETVEDTVWRRVEAVTA
jgi:voltage-dependent potassium channel beta subunit